MDARPNVFEVALESFQSDVVDRSREVPVILLFWTDQVPPAADTRRALESLATQYQGKFALALCDVATTPQLAQQLRVQGIPSIRVIVDGQIADQVEGPQGEPVLRQLIEGLTMSDAERLKDQLERFTAARDWQGALQILKAALQAEPNNPAFKVEWADVLVHRGDLDDAERVLASISEETPERERPAMRLELAREAASLDGAAALSRVAANGADLEARYEAAINPGRRRRLRRRPRPVHGDPADGPEVPRRRGTDHDDSNHGHDGQGFGRGPAIPPPHVRVPPLSAARADQGPGSRPIMHRWPECAACFVVYGRNSKARFKVPRQSLENKREYVCCSVFDQIAMPAPGAG